MQSRKSADHAKMVQVKGKGGKVGSFRIPIQACEKIESSESEGAKNVQQTHAKDEPSASAANVNETRKALLKDTRGLLQPKPQQYELGFGKGGTAMHYSA